MPTFSEESRLLIAKWEAVTDILEATRRLEVELIGIVRAVEPKLAQSDWWRNGWSMIYQEQGATLSNARWRRSGTDLISVRLFQFTPKSVFGMEPPPYLCLGVGGKLTGMLPKLIEEVKTRGAEEGILGELVEKNTNNYVVQQVVAKCLPEQLDEYTVEVGEQMLAFFDHYGRLVDEWTPMIDDYLKADGDA